jgi:D-glycero-D-manno-heptose 1,7-bisphosphate phosphatase
MEIAAPIAIFLDRDGTIIVDKNYLGDPDQVELLAGAAAAIGNLKRIGCMLFLFSNQSGVGRGLFSMDDAIACNEAMINLLQIEEKVFEEVCVSPELPTENTVYRKPSPRFIEEMLCKYRLERKNCFMVGDRESDVLAGKNAAINSVFITENATPVIKSATNGVATTRTFRSLLQFSDWLIGHAKI